MSSSSFGAKLLVSPDKQTLPSLLHPIIHKSFLEAIKSPANSFTIAISGGSLPSFLSTLPESFAAADIDPLWDKWHVLLADERIVPSTHDDSNLKAIKEAFLDKVSIPSNQIYGIDESFLSKSKYNSTTNQVDVNAIAKEYQTRALKPLVMSRFSIVLDCVLLGFGPDGHTCSLFPHHDLLQEQELLVAGIADSPKPPPERITLTYKVLNDMSRDVIFVGTGESKGPILKDCYQSVKISTSSKISEEGDDNRLSHECNVVMLDPPVYPCGMVRPQKGNLIWITDESAVEEMLPESCCCSSNL